MYRMGQYLLRDSRVHQLDPRIKIVSVILMSILVLYGGPATQSMITLFLMALLPLSHTGIRPIQQALKPMLIFFALLFFLHLFFTQGTPIPPFPSWRVTLTYEGLYTGTFTTWQFLLLVVTAAFLTMTTSPSELVNAIERLLRPFKRMGLPSDDVAMMISLALRFVPTLLDEIARTRDAQTARGARFNQGGIMKRLRAISSLVLPVILSTLRRADALAVAMEARGYGGGDRTMLQELSLRRADYVAMALMGLFAGAGFMTCTSLGQTLWPVFS